MPAEPGGGVARHGLTRPKVGELEAWGGAQIGKLEVDEGTRFQVEALQGVVGQLDGWVQAIEAKVKEALRQGSGKRAGQPAPQDHEN